MVTVSSQRVLQHINDFIYSYNNELIVTILYV